MRNKKVFTVILMGIPEREKRLLQSVFSLSMGRTPSFLLADPSSDTRPDIFMVDADNVTAMSEWKAAEHSRAAFPNATVLVTAGESQDSTRTYLRRPFVASRLLVLLEQVAAEKLNFAPPLAIAEEASIARAPAQTPHATPPGPSHGRAPFSALVVDDSLPVRVQMDLALRPLTSRVDFAESGEEAVGLLARNTYDIVFLDVVLPGVDGYEVCKGIKRKEASKHTPVIMLTSNSSPADRIKGKLAGCDTYLIKPVRHAVFKEVLENYLPNVTVCATQGAPGLQQRRH